MARKAAQIQIYANINDTKIFYEALIVVYGLSRFSLQPVRSTDGVLIKNKELIIDRGAEYLKNLLNKVHSTDPGFLFDLPTLPIIPKLDYPPSFDEVVKANPCLKDNKTACPDNISVEVTKHGGCALHRRLNNFSLAAGPLNVSHCNGKIPTLFFLLLLWSHRRRLKMILSSGSDGHGRRTNSSKVLPKPRR